MGDHSTSRSVPMIAQILKKIAIDLFPRTTRIRKQQHELISHYQLTGISVGNGKKRRLRILPN